MTETLILQIKQNKRKAQQKFYYKYAEQMFSLTYRYVNNEQDAGSIINIGFYKIFKNIDSFIYINEKALIAWMKKIIINEALIFLRRKINYSEIHENQLEVLHPKNISDNNLILEDYYNLIRQLPHDLRTVFNLYAIDGYSHKEIAEKMNIKESSSRVYLTRARKILQQSLTKQEVHNGKQQFR